MIGDMLFNMNKLKDMLKSKPDLPKFVEDLIFIVVAVSAVSIASQLALGTWQPMVVVESGSMLPNMNIGDIIIVQGASRTQIVPLEDAEGRGYKTFNVSGDVILYRPYGKQCLNPLDQLMTILGKSVKNEKATPIIHRAIRWVEMGEPMWEGGPVAPFSGYITKGDNNEVIDQQAGNILGFADMQYLRERKDHIIPVGGDSIFLDRETGLLLYQMNNETLVGDGISYLTPVSKDWVIGVARMRIPVIGYVRLLPSMIINWIRLITGTS